MTDKEIGAVWTEIQNRDAGEFGTFGVSRVRALVIQIVQERTTIHWHLLAKKPGGTNPTEALVVALRNFGIDPATWPERAD